MTGSKVKDFEPRQPKKSVLESISAIAKSLTHILPSFDTSYSLQSCELFQMLKSCCKQWTKRQHTDLTRFDQARMRL